MRQNPTISGKKAFTLVEIMIVCGIVGLLAVLALPSFAKARRTSRVIAFSEDLRQAYGAFQQYAIDYGTYPADQNQGVSPPGMASYFGSLDWTKPTPLGGQWDWELNTMGVSAGISVLPGVDISTVATDFQSVDARVDDGNLRTGKFYANGDRYTLMIEP